MPDFLHLPELSTLQVHDNGDHYVVSAEGSVVPPACIYCSSSLYRHGTQKQSYMDTPMHGKRVLIQIDRKRFRCKSCGKTLFEPLPAMDGKRLATKRLVQYVETHSTRRTFADIAREVGVDDKTVRHIFDDYVTRKKAWIRFETPEILGIDELKIIGQYRAMITNVEKLSLFDMLPTRKKADLLAYFKDMPDKQNVKVLTMDLWNVYRQVAKEQFPGRMIVADRFHVVRMANTSMERVRRAVRKQLPRKERIKLKNDRFILYSRRGNLSSTDIEKLDMWCDMFPELAAAYAAKEAFHDIYTHESKDDSIAAATEWLRIEHGRADWAFRDTRVALKSWWDEIFNYFDVPITNAYTESINNLAKGMNRMGRGYSFEVIRARLLYDEDARKVTRSAVRKKGKASDDVDLTQDFMAGKIGYATISKSSLPYFGETTVEYGPHIPTLVMKVETGDFS